MIIRIEPEASTPFVPTKKTLELVEEWKEQKIRYPREETNAWNRAVKFIAGQAGKTLMMRWNIHVQGHCKIIHNHSEKLRKLQMEQWKKTYPKSNK